MATVYVKAHAKGFRHGELIDDYVVEDRADNVLGTFPTQDAAIKWAKANGHVPHVARTRYYDNKLNPDQWRAV